MIVDEEDVNPAECSWEVKMNDRDGGCDHHRRESKIGERFLRTESISIVFGKNLMKISIYYDFFLLRESY